MTIKIEFPADDLRAARVLGAALVALGNADTEAGDTVGAFAEAVNNADLSDDAAGTTDTATVAKTDTHASPAMSGAQVDEHGVPFNPDMCSVASIPFYASGKQSGQWKRKKGVDQATYDAWHAGAKPPAAGTADPAVNTANAFAPDNGQQTDPAIPHDAGTLMAWVAGMQGAGRLTQDQVNSAYQQAGLQMPDIFPSDVNTAPIIAERVGKLYAILNAWA